MKRALASHDKQTSSTYITISMARLKCLYAIALSAKDKKHKKIEGLIKELAHIEAKDFVEGIL